MSFLWAGKLRMPLERLLSQHPESHTQVLSEDKEQVQNKTKIHLCQAWEKELKLEFGSMDLLI